MTTIELLQKASQSDASDLFIVAGLPLTCKINGSLQSLSGERLMPADTERIIRDIYDLADGRDFSHFLKNGDDDL